MTVKARIILIVIFLIVEGLTAGLVTIWFAVGAVGGVALISAGGAVMISALGLLFLLLTMLSDTVYYGISHSAAKVFTPFEMTYVMFLVGMAAFIPAALFQTGGLHSELITVPAQSGQFWLAVVYLGVLSSGVAYGLLNFANSHLTVTEASLFSNVTTVVSVLAGVVLLKETFDSPAESDMVISMLAAYGIPCFKYYDKDGGAGKVINGFSGYGASLYVPQTMLEEANNILNAEVAEEDENDDGLHA